MKLQSSIDVLLLCNGECLMKSIVCSQNEMENLFVSFMHVINLNTLHFAVLKRKKKKTWMTQDYLAAFHACWLQYHTRLWYIYIYISAILTFGVWLMFLLFFSDRGESKQESIRGTLHYLFEGVMPFLQVNVHWYLPDLCQKNYTCFPKAAILIYRLKL